MSKSSWGTTFDVTITKSFERGKTSLSAYRNISTQINGTPVEVSRYRWDNSYKFARTLGASIAGVYYDTHTESATGEKLHRNYYTVQTGLSWNFAQFWDLSARYQHKVQTFDNGGDDAIQNAAYLTLTYQWPRIAISR